MTIQEVSVTRRHVKSDPFAVLCDVLCELGPNASTAEVDRALRRAFLMDEEAGEEAWKQWRAHWHAKAKRAVETKEEKKLRKEVEDAAKVASKQATERRKAGATIPARNLSKFFKTAQRIEHPTNGKLLGECTGPEWKEAAPILGSMFAVCGETIGNRIAKDVPLEEFK